MGIYGKTRARIDISGVADAMKPAVESWFNARIRIVDPHIEIGAFNRTSNTKDRGAPDVKWEGPARIQAMRWPNVATARQEAVSVRTVVFHIPKSVEIDPDLIREGWRVEVLDGAEQPEFEIGLFVITTGINNSYAWDRRVETMMDQGAVITPPVPTPEPEPGVAPSPLPVTNTEGVYVYNTLEMVSTCPVGTPTPTPHWEYATSPYATYTPITGAGVEAGFLFPGTETTGTLKIASNASNVEYRFRCRWTNSAGSAVSGFTALTMAVFD